MGTSVEKCHVKVTLMRIHIEGDPGFAPHWNFRVDVNTGDWERRWEKGEDNLPTGAVLRLEGEGKVVYEDTLGRCGRSVPIDYYIVAEELDDQADDEGPSDRNFVHEVRDYQCNGDSKVERFTVDVEEKHDPANANARVTFVFLVELDCVEQEPENDDDPGSSSTAPPNPNRRLTPGRHARDSGKYHQYDPALKSYWQEGQNKGVDFGDIPFRAATYNGLYAQEPEYLDDFPRRSPPPDEAKNDTSNYNHPRIVYNVAAWVHATMLPIDRIHSIHTTVKYIRTEGANPRSLQYIVDHIGTPSNYKVPIDDGTTRGSDEGNPSAWVCLNTTALAAGILRELGYPVRETNVFIKDNDVFNYNSAAIEVWFDGCWHWVDAFRFEFTPEGVYSVPDGSREDKPKEAVAVYWKGTTTPKQQSSHWQAGSNERLLKGTLELWGLVNSRKDYPCSNWETTIEGNPERSVTEDKAKEQERHFRERIRQLGNELLREESAERRARLLAERRSLEKRLRRRQNLRREFEQDSIGLVTPPVPRSASRGRRHSLNDFKLSEEFERELRLRQREQDESHSRFHLPESHPFALYHSVRAGVHIETKAGGVALALRDSRGGYTALDANEIPGGLHYAAGTPIVYSDEYDPDKAYPQGRKYYDESVFFGASQALASYEEIGLHRVTLIVTAEEDNVVELEISNRCGHNSAFADGLPESVEVKADSPVEIPFSIHILPVDSELHTHFSLLLRKGIVQESEYRNHVKDYLHRERVKFRVQKSE